MDKSEVSFSRNIEPEKKNMLQMKLNFKAAEGHEKYLGLPTYLGNSKKRVFPIIQDRVWKKFKGWKEGFLSQAGMEILIKAVAQAIPTYAMQCFKIPVSILNEIDRMCRNFFWGQKKEERKLAWVAWERTFLSKINGGLGMRDLQAFNKAMLAKQAWRILNNTQSLMVKTLKQKYFPNSDFMSSKLNSNASYTWRSILSARDLIAKGAKKIVGKGHDINIWDDPWIPLLPNFRTLPRLNLNDDAPSKVAELISNHIWNSTLLQSWFCEWEIEAIKNIPLPCYDSEDRWSWHLSKNREFTVRSAYHAEFDSRSSDRASSSSNSCKSVWKTLWNAKVPPKIRLFGWKFLHNAIPLRSNLKRRNICTDDVCPVCGEAAECQLHALFACEEARLIWKLSPLRLNMNMCDIGSHWDWIVKLAAIYHDSCWWDLFWSLLWGIWLKRNAATFEKRTVLIEDVINKAICFVGEYEKANEILPCELSSTPLIKHVWTPPRIGVYKINSDAACFKNNNTGLGGVMRDHLGDTMAATCLFMKGNFAIDVAEAMAARHALGIAIEAGLLNVILETDNLKLFNQLVKDKNESSYFGAIVRDIKHLASLCTHCSYAHVGRKGNSVAHILANCSREYEGLRVWIEETPACANSAVLHDISLLK